MKAYQLESPATVKLPKLSPTEMELVREEMNTEYEIRVIRDLAAAAKETLRRDEKLRKL